MEERNELEVVQELLETKQYTRLRQLLAEMNVEIQKVDLNLDIQ